VVIGFEMRADIGGARRLPPQQGQLSGAEQQQDHGWQQQKPERQVCQMILSVSIAWQGRHD
jgi:hypothetical protein